MSRPTSGRVIRGVSTGAIYLGVLPFIGVQVLVIAALVAFPGLVDTGSGRDRCFDEAAVIEILSAPPGAEPASRTGVGKSACQSASARSGTSRLSATVDPSIEAG